MSLPPSSCYRQTRNESARPTVKFELVRQSLVVKKVGCGNMGTSIIMHWDVQLELIAVKAYNALGFLSKLRRLLK